MAISKWARAKRAVKLLGPGYLDQYWYRNNKDIEKGYIIFLLLRQKSYLIL